MYGIIAHASVRIILEHELQCQLNLRRCTKSLGHRADGWSFDLQIRGICCAWDTNCPRNVRLNCARANSPQAHDRHKPPQVLFAKWPDSRMKTCFCLSNYRRPRSASGCKLQDTVQDGGGCPKKRNSFQPAAGCDLFRRVGAYLPPSQLQRHTPQRELLSPFFLVSYPSTLRFRCRAAPVLRIGCRFPAR
jgi:hypothetical protein